jgi:hypothetical protein
MFYSYEHQGSARQLFQRLQGPIEEENLKAHFEKMILLMRQLHARRRKVHVSPYDYSGRFNLLVVYNV